MTAPTLYHIDHSGFYTGQTSEAPLDKLLAAINPEPRYLTLRGTTQVLPPVPGEGTWPRFVDGAWELAESHKGEYIWKSSVRFKCTHHGPLQEGHSLTPPAEIAEAIAAAQFKKTRAATVEALTVTVDGLTFDADEVSRWRMRDAYEAAETLGSPVVPFWRMADDTTAYDIPVATMKMAHAQAMVAMSTVWLPPSE